MLPIGPLARNIYNMITRLRQFEGLWITECRYFTEQYVLVHVEVALTNVIVSAHEDVE